VVIKGALQAIEDFASTNNLAKEHQPHVNGPNAVWWTALEPGWLKVNWDASVQVNQGWMGFELVVRDDGGRMVAALSRRYVGYLDPMVAEAWGALLAIKTCKAMRFSNVHLEGDTKTVVDVVNTRKVDKIEQLGPSYG
jgi:hypothetical protein